MIDSDDSNLIELFKYCNLTSVCVERLFSCLRGLLSDKRRSILSKNLFGYLNLNINGRYFDLE